MENYKTLRVVSIFEKGLGTLCILLATVAQIPFAGPILLLIAGPYMTMAIMLIFLAVSILLMIKLPGYNRAFSWVRMGLYALITFFVALLLKIIPLPNIDFMATNKPLFIHILGFSTWIVVIILIATYLYKRK